MDYLPAGSTKNVIELTVEEGTNPLHIINHLKIPFKPPLMVVINGDQLSPEELESRILKEGETMAIIPPMSGG